MVADLLPPADWVEREVRDYYALEFLGRDDTPALMLREGDERDCSAAPRRSAATPTRPRGGGGGTASGGRPPRSRP